MKQIVETEVIACPCCGVSKYSFWEKENGYSAVRCDSCRLIYVNPRPILSSISEAVKTGVHRELDHGRTAIVRRAKSNIGLYRRLLDHIFADVWKKNQPISWLDVGAGYGEFVEAVTLLAPKGSVVEGIEPMKPKADNAKARGLNVKEAYLHDVQRQYDFVSLINVFSHIPDFTVFMNNLKKILRPGGEFFIETGNIGDLSLSREVPTELDLPDHLVFAGEEHISRFLNEAGFDVVSITRRRKDSILNFAKNIVKKLLGRQVSLALPYTSKYRTILVRARLKTDGE